MQWAGEWCWCWRGGLKEDVHAVGWRGLVLVVSGGLEEAKTIRNDTGMTMTHESSVGSTTTECTVDRMQLTVTHHGAVHVWSLD